MEGEQRLECGGSVSIDDAIAAGRSGEDIIDTAANRLKAQIVAKSSTKV